MGRIRQGETDIGALSQRIGVRRTSPKVRGRAGPSARLRLLTDRCRGRQTLRVHGPCEAPNRRASPMASDPCRSPICLASHVDDAPAPCPGSDAPLLPRPAVGTSPSVTLPQHGVPVERRPVIGRYVQWRSVGVRRSKIDARSHQRSIGPIPQRCEPSPAHRLARVRRPPRRVAFDHDRGRPEGRDAPQPTDFPSVMSALREVVEQDDKNVALSMVVLVIGTLLNPSPSDQLSAYRCVHGEHSSIDSSSGRATSAVLGGRHERPDGSSRRQTRAPQRRSLQDTCRAGRTRAELSGRSVSRPRQDPSRYPDTSVGVRPPPRWTR